MPNLDELRPETFHKFEIFDGVNAEELAEIAECATVRSLDAGADIITEGERNRDLYGLLSGRAEVRKADENGGGRKLAELHPNAIIGELGLAVGAPRSATVRTLEPTKLLHVDGDSFHELQTAHRSVAYKVEHNILRILARRIGEMNREMLPVDDN